MQTVLYSSFTPSSLQMLLSRPSTWTDMLIKTPSFKLFAAKSNELLCIDVKYFIKRIYYLLLTNYAQSYWLSHKCLNIWTIKTLSKPRINRNVKTKQKEKDVCKTCGQENTHLRLHGRIPANVITSPQIQSSHTSDWKQHLVKTISKDNAQK